MLGAAPLQACVGFFRRVADDDDRQRRVLAAHGVEQHLRHVERRAVEDERVGPPGGDQIADARIEARHRDLVAVIAERERQQLRDLRRVVDQQNAHHRIKTCVSKLR